jgi:hypothetical protein
VALMGREKEGDEESGKRFMKIIDKCMLLIIIKYKFFIQYLYEYEYAGGIKINMVIAIVLNWM